MKIIIGLVGKSGSGKSFSAKYIKNKYPNKNIDIIKISDFLKEKLDELGLTKSAKNLQLASEVIKKNSGKFALRNLIEKKIRDSISEIIIVEGIRGGNVFNLVRSYKKSTLIFFETQDNLRYRRVLIRNEKYKEKDLSEKEFFEVDNFEIDSKTTELKPISDFVIINNNSLEELKKGIDIILDKIL